MDFDLNEEQSILKKSAGDFLAKHYPKELVRTLRDSDEGYSPDLWQKMAEMGWMGVMFPEEYGGSDGTLLDLMVLLEEMGYNLCPGPFFSTVVLGGLAILEAGNEEQKGKFLSKIAGGERFVTLAVTEPHTRDHHSLPTINVTVEDGDYIINATKLFVLDAHLAHAFLCVARTSEGKTSEEGVTVFLVDAQSHGITWTPLKTLEKDKQFEVVFDHVRVSAQDILGEVDKGGQVVADILRKAALARGAEMVGGARAVMDMAMDYAREREQFGRPIGTFQAVQHHFANMWMDIDGARYLLYRAAWKISQGLRAVGEVAAAKAHIGRACRRVTTLGHQIFAAISFTMEHDLHLYHRQSMAGDLSFGNSDFHRKELARELGLNPSLPNDL